jgi:hypothetical protein
MIRSTDDLLAAEMAAARREALDRLAKPMTTDEAARLAATDEAQFHARWEACVLAGRHPLAGEGGDTPDVDRTDTGEDR